MKTNNDSGPGGDAPCEVVVTVGATWDVAEVQFVAGLMAGVWLASAHNVLWGWLTRRATHQSNVEMSHAPKAQAAIRNSDENQ